MVLFVDHLCYFCIVLLCFHHVCLLMPCGHLLGKGWPLGSSLWCLVVTLWLSHWYPGSGVVLDYIDFWSLPYFLLCCRKVASWSVGKSTSPYVYLFPRLPARHIDPQPHTQSWQIFVLGQTKHRLRFWKTSSIELQARHRWWSEIRFI